MRIALAADHAGYPLKQHLVDYLKGQGHEVIDLGVNTDAVKSDYPDAAQAIGAAIHDGRAERGILVCGSGVGACIAANKIRGVYASITHDVYSAHQGVEHDKMNVMCLGALVVGKSVAQELANAFIGAQFDGVESHQRRFDKVQVLEAGLRTED
ncbi:MAG: RpiB/LacA/LacB family sugar-phosphate isomerase [Anaerolinea sp.]|nr:RpiB/LacA/LacB family sugar-phosphate isomerase [Anaerolinea sp.]